MMLAKMLAKINKFRMVLKPHKASANEFQVELYKVYWAAYVARLADLRAEDDYSAAQNALEMEVCDDA